MSSNINVYQEDWEALIGALQEAIQALSGKKVDPVKLKILEFSSTAAMLELQDLAECGNRFEGFLLSPVAPDWNEEATATLSFAMGALVEKMQMFPYSPEFSAGLGEVLMYLDFYGEGEAAPEPPVEPAAASAPPAPEPVPEETPPHREAPTELPTEEVSVPPLDLQPPVDEDALLEEIFESIPATEESPAASEAPAPPVVVPEPESAPVLPSRPASFEIDSEAGGYVIDRLDWYREVFREDPQSKLFTVLAEELGDRGLWSQVVEVCTQGLVYHPDSIRGRVLLGRALWETGRTAEARQVLTGVHRDLAANAALYELLAQMAELDQEANLVNGFRHTAQFLESEGRRFAFDRVARAPVAVPAAPTTVVAPIAQVGEPSPAVVKPHPTEPSADLTIPDWLLRLQDAFAEREPVEPVIAPLFSSENRELLKSVLSASFS